MNDYKYSVIIPVYNIAAYVELCVSSIVKNSYKNIEIILVNDGSTDNSAEVCDRLSQVYDQVTVIHQENRGVSAARNTGIHAANGDYVIFIDGDDWWEDTTILQDIADIKNSPDVIYMNSYYQVYPNGERKIRSRSNIFKDSYITENVLDYFTKRLTFGGWACYMLITKLSVITTHQIYFDEEIRLGEDADWLFRVLDVSKNVYVTDLLVYNYRVQRADSAMSIKSEKSVRTVLILAHKWVMRAQENTKYETIAKIFCNNAVCYIPNFSHYSKETQNELMQQMDSNGILNIADNGTALVTRCLLPLLRGHSVVMIVNMRHRFIGLLSKLYQPVRKIVKKK